MFKKPFADVYIKIPTRNKELFLTFDDGPTPGVTPEVLKILDDYGAKATFFCLGRNAERHPDLYNAIIERGHAVGNHTYSHLKGWKTNDKEYYDDIVLCGQFIQSMLFRPPYGRITPKQVQKIKKMGYKLILWDVLSRDYDKRVTPEKCLRVVLRKTGKGSIILFHDSLKTYDNLIFALPRVLEHFSSLGYSFSAITG